MERNLNHDDFDQFLKENADGLRMRPSDRVWKHIARELDRKKRRFGGLFALSLLLLTGAYITWEIGNSRPVPFTAQQQPTPALAIVVPDSRPAPGISPENTSPSVAQPRRSLKAMAIRKPSPAVEQIYVVPVYVPVAPPEAVAIADTTTFADVAEASPAAAPLELMSAERNNTLPEGDKILSEETLDAVPPVAGSQVLANKRTRKLSWQIFATPTVSYRILSDNKEYRRPILTPGVPAPLSALYSINDVVIHKPDMGIEFGVMARYTVSPNVRLRTGFQFNVNRYDIKALSYVREVATIALNNGPRVDSVRAITNYRNFTGGRTNWLQNVYFQASIPFGFEIDLLKNQKMAWGVASSLQPSYVIGNRSYMITADYKNYARVPWLTRRWNVNTSIETFVSLKSGKTQWQIGPQVRYQVMSSFISEYPVKENLFDFGMKVGITIR